MLKVIHHIFNYTKIACNPNCIWIFYIECTIVCNLEQTWMFSIFLYSNIIYSPNLVSQPPWFTCVCVCVCGWPRAAIQFRGLFCFVLPTGEWLRIQSWILNLSPLVLGLYQPSTNPTQPLKYQQRILTFKKFKTTFERSWNLIYPVLCWPFYIWLPTTCYFFSVDHPS